MERPPLLVSFTAPIEPQICGRDACGRTYAGCTLEERAQWQAVHDRRNMDGGETVRVVCGPCYEHYFGKPGTRRRDDTIHADKEYNINRDIAAANKGKGRRASIQPIGGLVPKVYSLPGRPMSGPGSRPTLTTRAHSSNNPAEHGYTPNHSRFLAEKEAWSRKALAVGNIKGTVSVRARMATIKPGQGSVIMIGSCMEGIAELDPHIGGDELHRKCYNVLQPYWRSWSNDYSVPLERTTLRGLKVYAPITGKARQQPANERDAILDLFMTTRKNGERVFKSRQVDLAVVIDDVDFQRAEQWREQIRELDGNQYVTKSTSTRRRSKMPKSKSNTRETTSLRSGSCLAPLEVDSSDSENVESDTGTGPVVLGSKRVQPATPENPSKRQRVGEFKSPDGNQLSSALSNQYRESNVQDSSTYFDRRQPFKCTFYEIPEATYSFEGALPKKPFQLDGPDIKIYDGTLYVDLSNKQMRQGSFKTAHPGTIEFDARCTSPFTENRVCAKQIYERNGKTGAIRRLRGREELKALIVEADCFRWASILLDLTYQFIAREVKIRGEPPRPIPSLRWARAMIAIVKDSEKVWLVEEWLDVDDNERPYNKYIGNRFSNLCLPETAPPKAREVADFLVFAQHVQWEKTQWVAFTSDYQGVDDILTDPQITTNPGRAKGVLGKGNISAAFQDFRTSHDCNDYCKHFRLTLTLPPHAV